MTYISLEQAKKHLNIEPEFTDDDQFILDLVEAATLVVEKDICRPLAELGVGEGQIPQPLQRAILLLVGTYYNTRETEVYGVLVNETKAYRHIIGLYRNFAG